MSHNAGQSSPTSRRLRSGFNRPLMATPPCAPADPLRPSRPSSRGRRQSLRRRGGAGRGWRYYYIRVGFTQHPASGFAPPASPGLPPPGGCSVFTANAIRHRGGCGGAGQAGQGGIQSGVAGRRVVRPVRPWLRPPAQVRVKGGLWPAAASIVAGGRDRGSEGALQPSGARPQPLLPAPGCPAAPLPLLGARGDTPRAG